MSIASANKLRRQHLAPPSHGPVRTTERLRQTNVVSWRLFVVFLGQFLFLNPVQILYCPCHWRSQLILRPIRTKLFPHTSENLNLRLKCEGRDIFDSTNRVFIKRVGPNERPGEMCLSSIRQRINNCDIVQAAD